MLKRDRPTPSELLDARDGTVADIIQADLSILFCGINPSLYSAATGRHFARPGNRFWPALFASGITPRLFDPSEGEALKALGVGITNVVERATARADELLAREFIEGGERLEAKVRLFRPKCLAVLGLTAYRSAFNRKGARVGLQDERIGVSRIWVLPNPSGLNAHYQAAALGELFRELRLAFP